MIDKKTLAKEMGVSISTVDRWMKQGVPYHRIGVKLIRFRLSEVVKWLDANWKKWEKEEKKHGEKN